MPHAMLSVEHRSKEEPSDPGPRRPPPAMRKRDRNVAFRNVGNFDHKAAHAFGPGIAGQNSRCPALQDEWPRASSPRVILARRCLIHFHTDIRSDHAGVPQPNGLLD